MRRDGISVWHITQKTAPNQRVSFIVRGQAMPVNDTLAALGHINLVSFYAETDYQSMISMDLSKFVKDLAMCYSRLFSSLF